MSLTLKNVRVSSKSRSVASGWTGCVDRMSSRQGYAWVKFTTLAKPLELAVSQLTVVPAEDKTSKYAHAFEGKAVYVPNHYRSDGGFWGLCTLVFEDEDGEQSANVVAFGQYFTVPVVEISMVENATRSCPATV